MSLTTSNLKFYLTHREFTHIVRRIVRDGVAPIENFFPFLATGLPQFCMKTRVSTRVMLPRV